MSTKRKYTLGTISYSNFLTLKELLSNLCNDRTKLYMSSQAVKYALLALKCVKSARYKSWQRWSCFVTTSANIVIKCATHLRQFDGTIVVSYHSPSEHVNQSTKQESFQIQKVANKTARSIQTRLSANFQPCQTALTKI